MEVLKIRYIFIYLLVILSSLVIANYFPIGNDEAYYIAFAKNIQLSYVDAPPFVAYLNFIQMELGLTQPLLNRIGVVILHLVATFFLLLIVKNHYSQEHANANNSELYDKLLLTFLISYITPIFGLYGIFILPDSGLILSLSIMLWVIDNIIKQQYISFKNSIFLGIGLGIGLLSKYHILPLGGGMILGLYLDLGYKKFTNLSKLILSVLLGLLIASPLFIWNFQNHFASFIFQLQHGFSSDKWQLTSMLSFILGSLLYLTPWFAYILVKHGLCKKPKYYLLIPFISLFLILLTSSLRKNILPHWIAPAFWILIPYAIINISNLKSLKRMIKYTTLIWLILIVILILPGGILNIKKVAKMFNPDTTGLADLLLWQELPQLFSDNTNIQNSLKILSQTKNPNCNFQQPLIGTTRWYWTAQLEYHKIFGPQYKILNLDLQSSNFYMWRDQLKDYANCPILIITDSKSYNVNDINQIMKVNNSYSINGLGDYTSLNLTIIEGNLLNSHLLDQKQANFLKKPHY